MENIPMVRISLSSMKREMVTALHGHVDEIKKEIDYQLDKVISAEGFKTEVSKIIQQQLHNALRDYVNRLIREALYKHEELLKAIVMEHVAKLMSEDQIKRLMQE
jgi:hypothetical protein